jgi:uncharacterized protein YjaG (DUF416 family)
LEDSEPLDLLIVERRFGERLEALAPWARLAFAAASAERVLPAYERFSEEDGWGDPRFLRRGLDNVWSSVRGQEPPESAAEFRARADELAPDQQGEVQWKSAWSSDALDALIAVVICVEAAEDPTVARVAEASQYEVEMAVGHVDEDLRRLGRTQLFHPDRERDLVRAELQHPLTRGTIELFEADLDDLAKVTGFSPEALDTLCERAQAAALPTRVEATARL